MAPEEHLRKWVLVLVRLKRRMVLEDPEMFATCYSLLGRRQRGSASSGKLQIQLLGIIQDGASSGVFQVSVARSAAAAVLDATVAFHHPYLVMQSAGRQTRARARKAVLAVLVAELKPPPGNRLGR